MPAKKYRVDLTAHERETLLNLMRSGRTTARQVTRARLLLKADAGLTEEEIAEEVAICRGTVERTRQRFVEESLGALTERPRIGAPPRLTGKGAAHLIAVTCQDLRSAWLTGDNPRITEFGSEIVGEQTVAEFIHGLAEFRGLPF